MEKETSYFAVSISAVFIFFIFFVRGQVNDGGQMLEPKIICK